jgi:hypothetical protein
MAGETRDPRRMGCRYHCATCGRHFSSLEGFDGHRAGEYADGRHCVSPLDLDGRLVVASESGFCASSGEHNDGNVLVLHPVTVWAAARLVGRAADAFSGVQVLA